VQLQHADLTKVLTPVFQSRLLGPISPLVIKELAVDTGTPPKSIAPPRSLRVRAIEGSLAGAVRAYYHSPRSQFGPSLSEAKNGREQPGTRLPSPAFPCVVAVWQVLSPLSDCLLCGPPLRGARTGGHNAARADRSGGLP
jgi:hypothetical protein